MEAIETIFSSENEIIEKLKGYAYKPDYKKIFFEHLGLELKKIFINKKDKVEFKNFIEAAQYEYGFFDTEIDLKKAFSLYKKYADLDDYYCMYKMHVIYLCEYEKFNVPLSRVLEKIYLLKCFAYLPNYIIDWSMKLFDVIDIPYEIAASLDLEDSNLEKHQLFFDLLHEQKEKYNLSENDINLMKGVLLCYFNEEGSDLSMLSFSALNSLIPTSDFDYAYYHAKNKSIFYNAYLKLNAITDSEIEKFYEEVEKKKLYKFYDDYGNYILDKKIRANPKTIELFSSAANQGYIFCGYRAYQCIIDYYDFEEIMQDYNKISNILDYLLDHIVFEKYSLSYFILVMGYIKKYSKYFEKINSKYLIYVKEINDYITSASIKKEAENTFSPEDGYLYFIQGFIYFFGLKSIQEQNPYKAIEFLDKGNCTEKMFMKKLIEFIKYNVKELMYNNKYISIGELNKAKKDLIEFFYNNLNLKYDIIDNYIIGEDFLEGITRKKDVASAFLIFNSAQNVFTKNIIECFLKKEINKYLKDNKNKIETKFNDEICCICYTNKVSKVFIPCKHYFCDFCADKLKKELKKCPLCRTEYLCIL